MGNKTFSPSRVDQDILDRANLSIANGALTNSKRPETFVKGVYPTHAKGGEGAYLYDTIGNRYIDYICGLGTNLLGYGNERIAQAIYSAAKSGLCLSLGSVEEVECAERIKEILPFIDRVRFLHGGSAAVHAALRIARGYTNRNRVLSEGYHGWHDEFVSLTQPAFGCVSSAHIGLLPDHFYDLDFRDVAAIIVEPVIIDASPERVAWLKELRDFCTRSNIVLIFDEIITGLRFDQFSVSRSSGVDPDLICLGKALGGGADLSVVGGKVKIMECGEYFVSATHAGERTGLVAAIETLKMLKDKVFDIDHLIASGSKFQRQFNEICPELVKIKGYASRGMFEFCDEETKHLFFQETCLSGILVGPSFFFSFAHIPVMDVAISIFKDVLMKIKLGLATPIGDCPKMAFAQKMREIKK